MKGVIRFPKMIFQGICYEKRLIKVDKKVLILVYVRACVRACVCVCVEVTFQGRGSIFRQIN